MKYYITPIAKLARYNIKIIFGNKFMYFILSAVGFYILTVGLNLISDSEITTATGYSMLLVPSILSIFYPTCFGIQNDQDAKIIEKINLRSGGVHLHIRFDGEVKCIDQKWLMRRKYT